MQVICSQMDFIHCCGLTFLSWVLAKNTSANLFFFFFLPQHEELSSRHFSASASFFHRLFISPFSAETMEGRRGNNGRFGWTSEKKGDRGGSHRYTHRRAPRQKEGGEEGKVMWVSDQALLICVCVSFGCACMTVWNPTHTRRHNSMGSLGHACPFTVHCAIIDGLNWYPNNEGVHGHMLYVNLCAHAGGCGVRGLVVTLKDVREIQSPDSSLYFNLFSFFFFCSVLHYTHIYTHKVSADTPTAGILHTCTCRHNRSRVGSRGMGPLREGPPPGPNQYMRSHASITESLLSQGLGGYNTEYGLCVWDSVYMYALTPVVSILLVSFFFPSFYNKANFLWYH